MAAGFDEGLQPFEIRERMDLREWQELRNFEERRGPQSGYATTAPAGRLSMLGGNLSRTYLEVEEARF